MIESFQDIYDQKALEKDIEANMGRPYQRCAISVMDTIADPNITFDADGICNYYHNYKEDEAKFVKKGPEGIRFLEDIIKRIKKESRGKPYDSILGLSGGVDSTYLCYLAKREGLRPLVVHCDNGWNSELAQSNVENVVRKCGFDLFTYVISWNDFKELQLSYIKASVVDIEALTDHAYKAVLYKQARKRRIKYVLSGSNVVTESVLPKYWRFAKLDSVNIKSIYRSHGTKSIDKLKSYPFINGLDVRYCRHILNMEFISPLNYVPYSYYQIKQFITDELGWRDYGGKHHESIWTRFYQGYLLPRKFNIDKRKAHLSNLIFSGQLTKEEAVAKLQESPYSSPALMHEDLLYVIKKLGISRQQFEYFMQQPRKEHNEYDVQSGILNKYPLLKYLKKIIST